MNTAYNKRVYEMTIGRFTRADGKIRIFFSCHAISHLVTPRRGVFTKRAKSSTDGKRLKKKGERTVKYLCINENDYTQMRSAGHRV